MRRWLPRALLAFVAFAACGGRPEPITPGSLAPDFSRPLPDGSQFELSSLAGEVVVLNFWATWCQPCRKEFPVLRELEAEPGIRVVGVALDEGGWDLVAGFARAQALDYTIVLGDQALFARYDGFVIPHTLLLDRERRIVALYRGPVEREQIERDLARIER